MDTRSRYTLTPQKITTLLAALSQIDGLEGSLIFSTCNRTEFHFDGGKIQGLKRVLREHYGIDAATLDKHFKERTGWEVAKHVFRLASGLESMILGEYQIVGQIKRALALSQSQDCLSPLLDKLCQSAFKAGKQVRNQTELSTGAASIAYTALIMAREFFGNLTDRSALVIGTGDMGRDVVYNLREKGLDRITVMNRTDDTAAQFAPLVSGAFKPFSEMVEAIPQHDIIITCTAAGKNILDADMLPPSAERRQLFLDLSVPANIDARVGSLPQARRIDLDMIQSHISSRLVAREQEIPKAEAIVSGELLAFHLRQIMDLASPALINLHAEYETIRQEEVHRMADEVGKDGLSMLDTLSRRLVKRLAARPLKMFREQAEADTQAMKGILDVTSD